MEVKKNLIWVMVFVWCTFFMGHTTNPEKVIWAKNVCFFGKIEYNESVRKKRGYKLSIINDTVRNIECKEQSYKVTIGQDYILLNKAKRYNYLTIDTLIFFENECFWKKSFVKEASHSFSKNTTEKVSINYYSFKNGRIIFYYDNFYIDDILNDSLFISYDIAKYIDWKRAGNSTKYSSVQKLEPVSDIKSHKLYFFETYISRKK